SEEHLEAQPRDDHGIEPDRARSRDLEVEGEAGPGRDRQIVEELAAIFVALRKDRLRQRLEAVAQAEIEEAHPERVDRPPWDHAPATDPTVGNEPDRIRVPV